MIRLPASSRGDARRSPGTPPPPSPYATPATITTPRMPLASRTRRSIGSFQDTRAGAFSGGLLGDVGVGAVDPLAADVEVGLAGAGEGFDRRIHDCGVEVGAGLV